MQSITSVDDLFHLLESGGSTAYFGEPVSVLEHSLQTAWFAQKIGADDALITASLLHDLGHLLHTEGEDAAQRKLDTRHENLAAEILAQHLPTAVLDPIRLHVAAKRFLCHAEPGYLAALSPASTQSLRLQGGPMSAAEASAFLALPYAKESLVLRRADDAAKVPELAVPPLESYRGTVTPLWH